MEPPRTSPSPYFHFAVALSLLVAPCASAHGDRPDTTPEVTGTSRRFLPVASPAPDKLVLLAQLPVSPPGDAPPSAAAPQKLPPGTPDTPSDNNPQDSKVPPLGEPGENPQSGSAPAHAESADHYGGRSTAAGGASAGASEHPADSGGHAAINLPVYMAIVLLLVVANGFFVASEFALVAVRKTRIDQLASEGNASARVVQGAIKDLDRYIAATQVGITVASLLLGGIGERTFHALFEPWFAWIPAGAPRGLTGSAVSFGMAYFVMTTLHVVVGELIPKSLALQFAEKVTLVIGRPMVVFARIFAPLIWLLNGMGNAALRAMGVRAVEGHGAVHSPEELDLLVSQSHEGGELNDTEAEILHRVVKFSDLTLREVMVPRVEMDALPLEMPALALRAWVKSRPHSRVPVYHKSHDEVIGVVHYKDVVPFAARMKAGDDDTVSLMSLVREVPRMPETSTVDKMLVEFKRQRIRMAIVIDEFGGTAGLVTLGDLLEQVFGTMGDEFDGPEDEAVTEENGRVHMPGRTLIEAINDLYDTGFSAEEADTMAGLVLAELGRPARRGDEVEIGGHHLKVEAVDRLRITRISMARGGEEAATGPS